MTDPGGSAPALLRASCAPPDSVALVLGAVADGAQLKDLAPAARVFAHGGLTLHDSYHPKNRSCLYVRCIKRGPDRAASQLNPVT